MKTYTHKLTNQRLELRKDFGGISSLYLLDENGNRIKQRIVHRAFNAKGEQAFEKVICKNKNLL